ncbi:uncharacterized protein LOC107274958 isoform X1 [Cephus cinctus]|uniref:Uncharacterized protein LOC107274958 isoform X1 n=1 Tax=Cephus cinctus TaxID=211228 RepID=A0AAJ7FVB5_CEPCN|nr:uncharacterized protein LOC107274958 isoform X1 [Cephus cinctus]XP_015610083.1 uncharacterized protein LOC107274958 isoform X1 [Cephus cinctus]XP_024935769.1 uncharacterized protein LOC107274958 isoform X1 [Cephus cinctus]
MEKWRSKGKSNVTTDSLLPPTRRFPNTSAIQPDKKKERKWSIGGFLKRISATRDSDSTSSGDNTGHPEKHTTSRHSRTASKAKVKNAPNAKLAYATDKHSPSPGNKKSDNLDKKEPVVIIEGNNDMESQVTRSQDSIHACRDSMHSRSSDGSLDCVSKKLRKEKIKARVEARRDQLCGDSSSDEGLSKSNNSLETFRSDESITNVHRNDSCNRKSRASRTERYIKRLSREDCSNGNNSNCVKSLATELALPHEDATVYHAANEKCRPPMHPRVTSVQTKSQAVTTFPRRSTASVDPFDSTTASNYHPRSFCSETCLTGQSQSSYDPFAKRTLEFCTDFNQNNNYAKEKKPSKMFRDEHRRQTDLGGVVPAVKNYASIQPVGCWQSSRRQLSTPPEPPPRDPQRRVFSFGSSDVSARPSSSSFDNNNRSEGLGKIGNESLSINNKKLSRNDTKNSHQYNSNDEVTWVETNISVRPRPSSVNSTFITTPPWKCNKAGYPINRYHCSDEENSLNSSCNSKSRKQKVENCSESETSSVSRGLIIPNSSPGQIQPIDPNMDRLTLQKDVSPIMDKNVKNTAGDFGKSSLDVTGELSQQYANRKSQSPPNPPIRRSSYVGSLNTTNVTNTADTEMADRKRNSRNLEEALSELEAIYNSLRLGDEDLLERAERRSMEEFARKDPKLGESLTNSSSGASDKSSLDGKSTEDHSSKPEVPDRLKDDMAYRRMNPKERPASLDSQTSLSKISYLFVSPVLSRKELDYNVDARKIQREEPDITRDDVVFRSINHANNMLRIVEPQPPFGIPLGPVTSATDSDYLHSIPIKPEQPRSSYIPKVEPDIVTDDLAFRNLRKDSHKDATTFHDIGEKNDRELINKGSRIGTNSAFGMKKNRAVRSLSANLYGLINKQVNSYNVYDQTRIPTNFQDALNKGNTSFRGKYDFAYDSDASRGQNVRHVMSDTESSEIGSRWFRSIDSDVDVNGNRSKGIFRRKLQVHVPPPKDTNSYDQDSANKLPDSSYGARTASPTFFSSSDKLFIGKTSSLPASSVVSPIRAKQVEPFTELEIAKYKKLCEDLENLVHLAKGGNAVLNTTENFSNNFITKDDKLNDSRANDRMMSNEAKEISENLSNLVDLANNELLTENEKKEKSNKFVQACKSTMDAVSDISSVQKVRENNKDSSTLDTSVPENDNVINGNKNTANNVCIETKTGDTCDKKMNQSEESESSAARKDEFIDKIKVENNNESKSPRTAFDDEKEVKISQSTSDSQGLANDKETVVDSSVLIVPDNEEPVNIVTDSEECDFSSEEHLLFNFEKLSYSSNRDGTSTSTSLEIVNPDDDIENVDDEDDDDDDNQYDDGSHNNDSNFKYHHEKEMRSDSTLDSQGGCEVMVAAGATSLMAAREGNPTNGTESRLVQRENQSTASRYHEAQNCQQNAECNTKKTAVTSSLNSNEHKNGPPQLEKTNNRLASRIESREGSKSPSSSKTTAIRETKASRLRAASIVSPNGSSGATSISRRSGVTESSSPWRLQSNITLRSKQKSPMSSDSSSTPNTIRERDKSYKRKSFLNRSLNAEEVLPDRSINQYDTSGRRGRRMTTSKRNQNTDTLSSSDSTTSRQSPSNPVKRSMESKETTPRRTTNQQDTGRPNDAGRPKNHASPSTAASIASSSSGMKSSSTQRTSGGGHDVSEVSRRVDALTALTRATMERVERLTANASPPVVNARSRTVLPEAHATSTSNGSRHASSSDPATTALRPSSGLSTRSCRLTPWNGEGSVNSEKVTGAAATSASTTETGSTSTEITTRTTMPVGTTAAATMTTMLLAGSTTTVPTLRHQVPVSILKHKTAESDAGQSSSCSSHVTLPVTFSPSVVEPLSKRHGILKKRSSLDENEILRRRSCSPDVSFGDSGFLEFRPILKNQRRSSLDEIIRRAQSPDPHPTSILKRKSSREDDGEDRQVGSPEPQGILKRKSVSSGNGIANTSHHVSITAAVIKAAASVAEFADGSEVRPILKKKHSREESSSSDPSSLEPRPILKKKSSTESEEHEDKPKKTILKCSRKSSQEDSHVEPATASPKKLSVLRNRLPQCRTVMGIPDGEVVRPILKQQSFSIRDGASRARLNFYENSATVDEERDDDDDSHVPAWFLRKRAQSVGHVQSPENFEEFSTIVHNRKSLGSASLVDVRQERSFLSRLASLASSSAGNRSAIMPGTCDSDTSLASSTISIEFPDSTGTKVTLNNESSARVKTTRSRIEQPSQKHLAKDIDMSERSDSTPEPEDVLEQDSEEERNKTTTCKSVDSNNEQSKGNNDGTVIESPSAQGKDDDVDASNAFDAQERNIVQRSNSVSKMASHFKALEEQVKADAEKSVKRRAVQKGSRGIQRYRERKQQGIDRFNTQPITYQEVQEAVLQNQRNTATNNSTSETPGRSEKENDAATTTDDEFDPSKLSLADRVRLFNQKIATESVPLAGGLMPRETSQKRRPANRYKTQPITSEEVEVACRISPLNVNYFHESPLDAFGTHHSSTRSAGSQGLSKSSMSLHPELPKSILKSSGLQTSEVSRPRTPELEGFSLLKSVLKKESEEQHQTVENSDLHPSSILKSDSLSKCDECSSARAGNVSVADKISLKSNATSNSELFKAPSGAEPFLNVNLQEKDLLLSDDTESEDVQYAGTEKSSSLSGFKNPVIQRQLHALGATGEHVADVTDLNLCKNLRSTSKSAKHLQSSTETLHTSDDETSSSGGREIRSIIQNELDYWRHQDAVAGQTKTSPVSALSKSASHHMLSREVTRNTKLMDTATMTTTTTTTEKRLGIPLPGLCRSATQPMPVSESNNVPGTSIAERLAALQRSGTTNWKKRVPCEPDPLLVSKLCDNDSVTDGASSKDDSVIRQGVLADRLGKLESAAEGWRKRVAMPDAVKFSVAGKMKVEQFEGSNSELLSPLVETTRNGCNRKKVPRPERFRSRKGNVKDASSTPSSPSKEATITFQRSFSEPVTDDSGEDSASSNKVAPTVSIPRADDETFTAFFKGVSSEKCESETLELNSSDFDLVTSYSELLVQKRIVRTQRRRLASKNPLRALAARTDLKTEYTEIKTGVAEKVMRSLNIEKLAKSSSFAVEALAGLASTENFSAVTLKTLSGDAIGHANKLCAYKDLMLILVKGRRHVQVRLVEPIAASVNSGDNYILVTKTEIYNYVGKYSNVIERARAVEIAQRIQQTKDLGSQASEIITISEDKPTCSRSHVLNFWNHLGVQDNDVEAIEAGHPDEDELYESAVIDTNMVYEITGEELVPFEKYWGSIPKIEMLDPSKILVFDFGSEMYIWNGKTASMDKRKVATRLTKELWEEGYDYEECAICPINAALTIGRRAKIETLDKKGSERPSWCLFGKLTQHMETILFREKFLDWPDFSRVIRTKDNNVKEQVDGSIVVEPSNIDTMIQPNTTLVDFVLEGTHLGRGTGWYDEELMRHHEISTTNVTVWHVDEFSYTLLSDSSVGQFFSSDSYIVRWMFTITITGRELSGQPSKHSVIGRDRCVYFIWQGKNASLNEQGTAALLTVELDREEGRQVRVVQGFEPAVFLNLFSGRMVVNNGKRMEKRTDSKWRMYICRGTLESETSLVEVPCSARQLRSRGSILLLGATDEELYVWHGSNTLPHIRQNALNAANLLKKNRPEEVGLTADSNINICEINEGEEPKEFFTALGGMKKKLYVSLTNAEVKDHTPRLFHFSSLHGVFTPTELLCAHRAELATPFPFLQEELYQVNQPALFLLDNRDELWVWQGWWPDTGDKDQTGSGAVRWQAERRALMNMAIQYWKITHPEATDCPVYLVWAGLEPLQFTNLFPIWVYHDDVAEINIRDGRKPGEVLSVEAELARLTKSTYPPAQLLQRPLPEGVDPTCLELYLSPQHFKELLGMTKEVFQKLPIWKQLKLKKNIGLF